MIQPAAPPATDSTGDPTATSGFAVGIDIGGTNTKFGFVDPNGEILARREVETRSLRDPASACRTFREFAADQIRSLDLSRNEEISIGVAVPGVLQMKTGFLEYVANLPEWCEFPLLKALEDLFTGPVAICNDANAAAFAEFSRRELNDESLALLTLGTGIGCGVVIGGNPYGGDHGCGFEVGHAPIAFDDSARICGCGKPGHLEAYVGANAVLVTAREQFALFGGPSPTLMSIQGDKDLSPRHIAAAAEAGDEACWRTVNITGRYVGLAVCQLCQTLDPSYILIGGAMTFGGNETSVGRQFLQQVIETSTRYSLDQVASRVVIEFASLGNDAGICGIAELSRA